MLLVPLAFLGAVWGAGAAPLPWTGFPPWWTAVLPCGLGGLVLALARRPAHVSGGMALLALALGILRAPAGAGTIPPSVLARRLALGPVAAVRGEVVETPVARERIQRLRLRVVAARAPAGPWAPAAGSVQVTLRPAPALHAGEVLEIWGDVAPPDAGGQGESGTGTPAGGTGGYGAYLRRQGIDGVVAFPIVVRLGMTPGQSPRRAAAQRLREGLAGGLESLLPEPQAALVAGMLLGQRSALPMVLQEQLARSGTSHLIAVSGYNVGLVVSVAAVVARELVGGRSGSLRLAGWASAALWAFVALVGPSGSVLRAAAMAQLALVGRTMGREGAAGALLLWGNALLVAWRPGLVEDVGWQLSFLGTAGLVWLAPAIACLLAGLPRAAREGLGATLAAQIFVLPVVAVTFGRVSVVAPLANVLALPLVGPIMLGGAGTALASVLYPPLAPLLAGLTWAPSTALLRVVAWTAGLPLAEATIPPWPRAVVAGYLAALVILSAFGQRWAGRDGAAGAAGAVRRSAGVQGGRATVLVSGSLVALAAVGCAMATPYAAPHAVPTLLLSIPTVPDGTLALARAPDGARLLLDGGPGTGAAAALLGEHLRPWDRAVDAVAITDRRDAYVLGLPRVVERYRPGVLLDAPGGQTMIGLAAYTDTLAAARRHGVPRRDVAPGSTVAVGRDLRLEVLETSDTPAWRVAWGDFGLLVPGEPATRWSTLLSLPRSLRSDVLLLSQQTAADPALPALLRAAEPALVVVQGAARGGLVRVAATEAAFGGALAPAAGRGPRWHFASRDGPVRLEVQEELWRLNGGPWQPRPRAAAVSSPAR